MLGSKSTGDGSVFGFGTLRLPGLGALVLGFGLTACGVTHDDTAETGHAEGQPQGVAPGVIQQALITGADTCAAATLSTETFDEPVAISDTTVGATDDYDLPDAMNPTCSAAPACVGTGNGGSARGTVWQGSGTGPDRVFRFQVASAMTLTATMMSDADMGLYLFSAACTSQLSSCACVSDNAFANMPETISSIEAVPGVDYYFVVDGYLDPTVGGSPSQGAFDLSISKMVPPVCGNDMPEVGETCDDGNTESCDGCRADCSAVETGCGDGFICDDEECDDHNTSNGDGCSASCTVEGDDPLPDGGSQTPDSDGGTLPNAGAGGTSGGEGTAGSDNGGSSNGTGGSMSGGNTEVDGSVEGTGGRGSSTGKGQTKGGGTMSTAGTATTVSNEGESSSGCAIAHRTSGMNTAGLAMVALIFLRNARRRARVAA
jgi:cysteine-rich repeat protein